MSKSEIVTLTKGELAAWLDGADLPEVDDPDEAVYEISLRYLAANSVDALLEPQTVLHANEYRDRPFTVLAVDWRRSRLDGQGPGRFAVLQIVTADGEPAVMTCGATQAMVQLGRLVELDALPVDVVLRSTDRPTSSGGFPLWLERPGL